CPTGARSSWNATPTRTGWGCGWPAESLFWRRGPPSPAIPDDSEPPETMAPMSDQKTLPRPPQATLAGWITILGSAFVLFSVFGVVAENRSIETREQVNDALGEAPLEGSGIGLQQALDFLHVTALI